MIKLSQRPKLDILFLAATSVPLDVQRQMVGSRKSSAAARADERTRGRVSARVSRQFVGARKSPRTDGAGKRFLACERSGRCSKCFKALCRSVVGRPRHSTEQGPQMVVRGQTYKASWQSLLCSRRL